MVIFCCLLLSTAFAQRVRWEPAGGSLAIRQTSELSLIFDDCEPTGTIALPPIPNLELGPPNRGEQNSFQIINGQSSRRKTVYFTYPARPTAQPRITIPAFDIPTDKGVARVASVSFEVGTATVGGSDVPLENAANSELTINDGQPLWAGQVVPVTYTLSVSNRFPASIASAPTWDPLSLVHEEWSEPAPFNSVVNGEARANVRYTSRGYVRAPGRHPLGDISQLINLRVPSAGFSVLQSFQAEQYTISSNRPTLDVRPLPTPAPAGFSGAVGEFTLESTVVPQTAVVGEPVTWTLNLAGTGNWPDITALPPRNVSRDFRVVQPQAQRTPAEGKLFEATLNEDVVLIPTTPGTYTLGPVVWSYFDPAAGTYRTVRTEPVEVTITAPAAADPNAAAVGTPRFGIPTEDDPTADAPIRATPTPAAPSRSLLDPLPTDALASPPPAPRTILAGIIALLALPPLLWLALAVRTARRANPGRLARAARRRLGPTLTALATDPADAQPDLIRAWRRDTARLWNLDQVEPPADAFATHPAWATLWRESDALLYGPAGSLPADWPARATAAWRTHPAPRFAWSRLWRTAHWFPALALLLLLAPPLPAAESLPSQSDPATAYAAGDFSAAATAWEATLAEIPTAWPERHNLSLALAQQKRWQESAAHAAVAFVQAPRESATRWQLTHALERAGYTPPHLGRFASPDALTRLAALASPTEWLHLRLVAAALLALALILRLLRAYTGFPPAAAPISLTLAALAILLGIASGVALPRYGPAADPRAVIVPQATVLRTIPTEVAAEQETTPLAAGSIAITDQSFLGWRRLVFPNGQTGWLRTEDLIPFWQKP